MKWMKWLVAVGLLIVVFTGCEKKSEEDQAENGIIGNLNMPPEIQIVDLNPGDDIVRGTANNINIDSVRVVLWAKTDVWYVQPLISNPYTEIRSDGTWENWTHPWIQMLALLVDMTYLPGSIRLEHPSSDSGVLAWDEYPFSSVERTVEFSGYTWKVKDADLAGPGPNYFSDSIANVWTDADGLHLRIVYQDGRWYCSEVFLGHSLGYGQYIIRLGSRVDSLDENVVLGCFIYESASREVDIEFSQLLASPYNAQYVVQPYWKSGNILKFPMPQVEFSSHRFVWHQNVIEFTSWQGLAENPPPDSIIHSWIYTGDDIPPPGGERMRFNLWLFNGSPPQSTQEDEVIIKSFNYQP